MPRRSDRWGPALAKTEARVEKMLAQSAIQDQLSSQIREAVNTELYRFLGQPLSDQHIVGVGQDRTATPSEGVQALDSIPARNDALRTKPFRL